MTIVRTSKGLAPVAVKSWPLAGTGFGGWSGGSYDLPLIDSVNGSISYADLYRQQPWVAIVVNKLARGIARLPLKSYRLSQPTGDRERVREHPLPQLFAQPYPRGSAFRWKEATIGSLCLYGNALSVKYRARKGQPPSELWPVPWRYVRVVAGTTRPIDRYEYNGPAGRVFFEPADVIHFEWWSPEGVSGVSPLEPLRRTLAMEEAAQRYAAASFANGVRPSGALVSPGTIPRKEELKQAIRAATAGPDRAFGMLLLEGGLDWRPFSHTAQESEVISHRKLNREEVAAAFDIPPPLIGILDHATFANITEQHLMLYMDSFGPWLTMLEETLAAQLVAGEPAFADIFCEFDISEVMRGAMKERFDAYNAAISAGWITRNEVRKFENLPAVNDRGADSLSFPLNMQQLDGAIGSPPGSPVGSPALASLLHALAREGNGTSHT